MAFVVAVGMFVTAGAATGIGAALIGGAVIGAVAGGVIAAATGEDILKGALVGGLAGAAILGGGAVVGGAASTSTGLLAGPAAPAVAPGTITALTAEQTLAQGALATGVGASGTAGAAGVGLTTGDKLLLGSTLAQTASGAMDDSAEKQAEAEANALAQRQLERSTSLAGDVRTLKPTVNLDAKEQVAEATAAPSMTAKQFLTNTSLAYRLNTAPSTVTTQQPTPSLLNA